MKGAEMKFFIDTANLDEIAEAKSWGCLAGVTTNPSLYAKTGGKLEDFEPHMVKIAKLCEGLPVSAESTAETTEEMIAEGQVLAGLDPHVVVKIPMTGEGMKAVSALSDMGIRSNVTLIFSAGQALLAARGGASYVSPFVGRIDDIGWDGVELIRTIADIFRLHKIKTEIIAASVRKPQHVAQCALAGADIATVPYQVLMDTLKHPLTDIGIARFKADWEKAHK